MSASSDSAELANEGPGATAASISNQRDQQTTGTSRAAAPDASAASGKSPGWVFGCSGRAGRRAALAFVLVAVIGVLYMTTGSVVVKYAGSVLEQTIHAGDADSAELRYSRHKTPENGGGTSRLGKGEGKLKPSSSPSTDAKDPTSPQSEAAEPKASPDPKPLDPATCAVPPSVQQCLLNTYPLWEPDCSVWKGKTAWVKDWPGAAAGKHECTLQRRPKEELQAAMNRTQITFIGDSTSRRAGLAAYITLTGASWTGFDRAGGHHDFHYPVVRQGPSGDILFSNVVSWWSPFVPLEADRMKNATTDPNPPYLAAHLGGVKFDSQPEGLDRFVLVIGATTWDFLGIWRDKHHEIDLHHTFIDTWSDRMAEIVGLYKALPGYDATRDMIIVRLPVGEACLSKEFLNHCYNNMTGPSVNDFVLSASAKLQSVMESKHPDVPLLPMAPWTVAENPDHGRNECVPSDDLGTHMVAPESLYGYSEMVMNAVITVDNYRRDAGCDWQAFSRNPRPKTR